MAGDNAERKRELRAELRARRRTLSTADQRRHGRQLAMHVARQSWFRAGRRIALYLPVDGEMDTWPLLRLCWRLGKAVYLPRTRRDGRLEFARYAPGDPLRRGSYGIPQPGPAAATVPSGSLDVVFTPLVGFTPAGGRLGMGGGYYDRTFAGTGRRRPLLVGLAHSCQCVDALPGDDWDVGVGRVITETGAMRPPFPIH